MKARMLLGMLAAVAVAALFMTAGRADSPPAPALDKEAIGQIVHEYLIEHPKVLEEAMQVLQQRREIAQRDRSRDAIVAYGEVLRAHPLSPVSGNPEGDVTVVEFFDYRCGYCKRAFPSVMALLGADSQVRVVWKEFPILGPVSDFAARAAMAADKQGLYHEFHVAVMGTEEELTEDTVIALAAANGLDVERLLSDMGDPAIEVYLEETRQLAQALGITGTPAFVVGETRIPGAVDPAALQAHVSAARAGG